MSALSALERVKQDLIELKMVSALEALDGVLSRVERGEISTLEAFDALLGEETDLSVAGLR